jgi:DNA-binding transcriptional LysR family regulator
MDTRFVETFLTAVDNGSIAEAARRLNVTPAAAAKRIRALESEVGAVLVRRSGRTVKPTEKFRLASASRGAVDCADQSVSAFSKAACDLGSRAVHSLESERLGRPPYR